MMHGLGWADFGARRYDPVIPQWTQPDPLAEKYCHLSPYSYCAIDPVNKIDPDGQEWVSAQYEDDYFFFWHDKIKNQANVNKMFPNNENIKYLGESKNIDFTFGSDALSIGLNNDGSINFNNMSMNKFEMNDVKIMGKATNLHIGNSNHTLLPFSEDPSKGYESNWYGLYLGPNNPKAIDGSDSYLLPPISELDYAAYKHDKSYDILGAKGISGAILQSNTSLADLRLIRDATKYLIYGNRTIEGMKYALGIMSVFPQLIKLKN